MTFKYDFAEGSRLFDAGKLEEAYTVFEKLHKQHPNQPDLLNALGSVLDCMGANKNAAKLLRQACQISPNEGVFHYNLGNTLRHAGFFDDSEQEFLSAIDCKPGLAEAYYGLGNLYLEKGELDKAEACLQNAINLRPDFVFALHDLGHLALKRCQISEAESYYRSCLGKNEKFVAAWNDLGMLLLKKNQIKEAQSCFEQGSHIDPMHLPSRCNLAVLDTWCGRLDKAINTFYDLFLLAPEDGDIHFNLSLALLAAGRFEEGWQEHEWRFRKSNPVQLRHQQIPRWCGEPLSGKTILLHAEQGYGDSLQFIRYAPLLVQRGATVIVEGQDAIITPLLATVSGISATVSRGELLPLTPDFQVPMMSLASAIGTDGWPPPSPPYLNPSTDRVALWRQRLSLLSGLKVGIAWAGRPEHQNDANRSIPPELCAPLGQLEGISWISLQFGSDRPKSIPVQFLDLADKVADFCDSAALVSALDLVLTVDSAVAHLAGAIGVPVWLLLPWNPDWRWMRDVRDSIWYPTMRIYRQASPDGWPALIDNLLTDLLLQTR